ncbi:hypothetical protein [Shewanella aestuarii]|uniref:Uncharacterized protein n=1 Tax=Shewanella aestuarii TaxID=1028752 RepID=A0A6G9QQF0_9GAMM|nr:hypothetical protein [Shewanella aestuarii]QIR16648.1 hypothetical protein HBH39_19435 [Shewanella aestuarii]
MNVVFNLKEITAISDCIRNSITKVEELAKEAGYQDKPYGFEIDECYCDWHDISTGELIGIIDDCCGYFGAVNSQSYQNVCQYICERINEHFVLPTPDIIVRKHYIDDHDFLDFQVKKSRWDELMLDYSDAEVAIGELIASGEAVKVKSCAKPSVHVVVKIDI